MANLLSWGKKAFDQVNPFDNGRTWQNQSPAPRPIFNRPPPRLFNGGNTFVQPTNRYGAQTAFPTTATPTVQARPTQIESPLQQSLRQGKPGDAITLNDVANWTVRPITRGTVRIGKEYAARQTGQKPGDSVYTPSNRFDKFILGEKPVESFSKYGRDTGVKGAGGMALGVGLSALDVLPLPGKGKVAQELIEASTKTAAKKALKKVPGLTASAIERLAPVISKSKNSKFIERAIKTETLTPGRAKQITKTANRASDTPQLQPQLFDVPSSGISNELNVLKKLSPRTKPIPLAATVEQTADVATKTTKAGNVLPLGVKSGTMITKKVADIPIRSRPLFGTPERVIKQITKDPIGRELLTKTIVAPQDKAVTQTAKEVEKHLGTLKSIFKSSSILSGKKVNKGLGTTFFNFVEKGGATSKVARHSLYKAVGNTRGKKIIESEKKLRPLMDDLFKRQNVARQAVGKAPIPYRKNYITHLKDEGFLGGLNIADTSVAPSPFSRATGRLNPFSKERKGAKALTDPVKATEAYVRAATAEINSHEPVARLNTLIDALGERGDVPNNVMNWLSQQRDIVGGQGNRLDRTINSFQSGKVGLEALNKLTQQAGRNLIGGNPSSVLTQPAQLVQSGAKLGWRNTLRSLSAPLRGEKLTTESAFLTGRHAHLDNLAPGLGTRLVNASLKPIEGTQKAIDRIIFDAAKHRAGQLGLKGQKALDWADTATKETVAARGLGQTPHAYSSKIGNALGQFSLEMGNSIHQLAADELKHGRIGGITSFMIGAYGFNQAFNAITGKSQGVILDPIQAGLDVKKDIEQGNYVAAAGRLPGEIVANVPGGQVAAGTLKSLNPKLGNQLFGQAGAGRYGVGVPGLEVAKAGLNVFKKPWDAAAYASPTAGVPIKRGLEGLMTVAGGEAKDKKGDVMYNPAQTPQNYIRGTLFGRSTTGEGKKYGMDLQDKLIGNTPNKPSTSPEQKEATAKAEIETLKKTAGNGRSLQQLANGKYAYTLNGDSDVHTAKNIRDAREAIAKDGFKDESGSYKIIGNKVYRKNSDGDVSIITKDSFDYQIGSATLTSQKRADNLEGWMETANSQLDLIDKQLQASNIDPLEAIKLQNQADQLLENMEKYQGYGGFTKPKSGRRGGSGGGRSSSVGSRRGSSGGVGTLSSSFKTASRVKAPSLPKITVRSPKSFTAPTTRKYAVSRIPSSYTKRKLG